MARILTGSGLSPSRSSSNCPPSQTLNQRSSCGLMRLHSLCNPRIISHSTHSDSAEAPQLGWQSGHLGLSRGFREFPSPSHDSISHPNATVLLLMFDSMSVEKLAGFTHHQYVSDIQTQPRHDSLGYRLLYRTNRCR